uniref:Secreted protein n=1 Tax=Trichogramma kaykai TaxID=54128 RepID=A0ABD2XJQ3_9HYME
MKIFFMSLISRSACRAPNGKYDRRAASIPHSSHMIHENREFGDQRRHPNMHLNSLKTIAIERALKKCKVFVIFETVTQILFGRNTPKTDRKSM